MNATFTTTHSQAIVSCFFKSYRECKENKLRYWYTQHCACALAVQHEQWMCLGMQRHTHITLCNLVTM